MAQLETDWHHVEFDKPTSSREEQQCFHRSVPREINGEVCAALSKEAIARLIGG